MCSCIRGLLSEHLVILVTHQLQFALQANKILVVKEVTRLIKDLADRAYLAISYATLLCIVGVFSCETPIR